MKLRYKLSNDITIEVNDTPFASGGEADIHEIISPGNYAQQVLKIYKPDKRTRGKEDKLKYLIANKPNFGEINTHHPVIWPTHIAFASDKFVGYTMPKATGIKLELLCYPKLPTDISREFRKFSSNTPGSLEAKLKLCYNISAALSQVHSFGSYVLVDMKPDNIMVRPDGLISIIDVDSTEIINGGRLIFPAQVATPEYTPPEYYKGIKNIETDVIEETWDRFSLAVIFYRLLFGVHPFTGTLKQPFEALTTVNDIIQKGFLPFGKARDKFKVIPPPHNNFSKIDDEIRYLFISALEESHDNPSLRPSADDWCKTLSPDPGIQLNRVLPSRTFKFFVPLFTQTIAFKAVPEIKIRKPSYLVQKEKGNIIQRILRSFIRSERNKQWSIVIKLQNKTDAAYNNLVEIKRSLEEKHNDLGQEQTATLTKEKSNIEALKNGFIKKASPIDQKAKSLFFQETERYNKLNKAYLKEFNLLEFKIKEVFEVTVRKIDVDSAKEKHQLNLELERILSKESQQIGQLENEQKIKLDDIKGKIQALENELVGKIDEESRLKLRVVELRRNQIRIREKTLITQALEKYQSVFSENQLKQYRIADDKYEIFTDIHAEPIKICVSLAKNGITTAADIKGVDESGKILRSNGTWVKTPGVAAARASRLNDWRKRKERQSTATSPQTLPYSEEMKVKQLFAADIQKVNEEERVLKQEIFKQKAKIPDQLSNHLEGFKKQEQEIISLIQSQKLKLMSVVKIEKQNVQNKINELLSSLDSAKSDAQSKFDANTKQYRDRLEHLKGLREIEAEKVKKEFDPLYDLLLKEVIILDDEYKKQLKFINDSILAEIERNVQRYQIMFERANISLNEAINVYNDLASELDLAQSKYLQM